MKLHLNIRKFLGENKNAIKLQLLAAMIAFVLLRIAAHVHGVALPPLRFAELVGGFLFSRRTLAVIEESPPNYRKRRSQLTSLRPVSVA